MLRVEGLGFLYGSREVFRNVIFEFKKGVGCFFGLNGVGKSIFFKCIVGIFNGNGRIMFNGIEFFRLRLRECMRFVSYFF